MLKYILFFLFPVFLFGQSSRIAVLESDSILVASRWYTFLKEDIQAFADVVEDSILDVEMEKHRFRCKELMEEYERYSCSYGSYQKEMEEELQERNDNIKHLANAAERFLAIYENDILELWKEELTLVIDSLAVVWRYDFVLNREAMVFLPSENTKEQVRFKQAILKALNERIGKKDWKIKTQMLQKKCLDNIQKEIYVHPLDVQKELLKLDVFRKIALWMHGAKLT